MYYYDHMFNPQWVNENYYNSIKTQAEKQQYYYEQNREVGNATKAMRDLCEAVKKLDESHQQDAFWGCLMVLAEEFGWKQ